MAVDGIAPRRRKSIRLRGFDYGQAGAYFVTVCTYLKMCLLGEVVDGVMRPSSLGAIVVQCRQAIGSHFACVDPDMFVVMRNHVHGIISLLADPPPVNLSDAVGATHASPLRPNRHRPGPPPASLGVIIGSFKAASANRINTIRGTHGSRVWQRGFYDHVIRGVGDLARVRQYIEANPACWTDDEEYSTTT